MASSRHPKDNHGSETTAVQAQTSFDQQLVLSSLASWDPDELFTTLINTPTQEETSNIAVEDDNPHLPSAQKDRRQRTVIERRSYRRCINKPPQMDIDDDTLVGKDDGILLTDNEKLTLRPGKKKHWEFTRKNKEMETVSYHCWLKNYIWVFPYPTEKYELVYVEPKFYAEIKKCSGETNRFRKYFYGEPPIFITRLSSFNQYYDGNNFPKCLSKSQRNALLTKFPRPILPPKPSKGQKKTHSMETNFNNNSTFFKKRKKQAKKVDDEVISINLLETQRENNNNQITQVSRGDKTPRTSTSLNLEPWTPISPLVPGFVVFTPALTDSQLTEELPSSEPKKRWRPWEV